MDLLDRLRNKSTLQRNLIALGAAFVVTAVIAGVWFTTRSALDEGIALGAKADEAVEEEEHEGPLTTFEDGFGKIMREAKKGFAKLGEQFEGMQRFENLDTEGQNKQNEDGGI